MIKAGEYRIWRRIVRVPCHHWRSALENTRYTHEEIVRLYGAAFEDEEHYSLQWPVKIEHESGTGDVFAIFTAPFELTEVWWN